MTNKPTPPANPAMNKDKLREALKKNKDVLRFMKKYRYQYHVTMLPDLVALIASKVQEAADLQYEIEVLKQKLDEKQASDMGITVTFTLNAEAVKTPKDFVDMITLWAFHRGNWQNFINQEELTPWIDLLSKLRLKG